MQKLFIRFSRLPVRRENQPLLPPPSFSCNEKNFSKKKKKGKKVKKNYTFPRKFFLCREIFGFWRKKMWKKQIPQKAKSSKKLLNFYFVLLFFFLHHLLLFIFTSKFSPKRHLCMTGKWWEYAMNSSIM